VLEDGNKAHEEFHATKDTMSGEVEAAIPYEGGDEYVCSRSQATRRNVFRRAGRFIRYVDLLSTLDRSCRFNRPRDDKIDVVVLCYRRYKSSAGDDDDDKDTEMQNDGDVSVRTVTGHTGWFALLF